jgi:hypothetical protein
VRWAAPARTIDLPHGQDARRKVGVREARGETTCVVLGKGKKHDTSSGEGEKEGIILKLEYKGTCKGVWFPGVATLLGLDVGLVWKNSDVTWVDGMEAKWTVTGETGFTGWDVAGLSPAGGIIQDAPEMSMTAAPESRTRQDSGTSTSSGTSASLLRVALPMQNVGEYSFEGSAASSAPSGMLSSLGSLSPTSPISRGTRSRANSISSANVPSGQGHEQNPDLTPPVLPITVHVNINDLIPPSKNIFTFTITGTVLVTPKPKIRLSNGNGNVSFLHSQSLSRSTSPTPSDEPDPDADGTTDAIVLPHFTILAADAEHIDILLRNDAEGASVDVYAPMGDLRAAQTRRTVLKRGGSTKCGVDGERIALRPFRPSIPSNVFSRANGPGRALSHASSASSHRDRSAMMPITAASSGPMVRPRRDGPLMIPHVVTTVTPLSAAGILPDAYAVRVCLPAPSDRDSEWLEFGFAHPRPPSGTEDVKPPKVEIASVSLEGVPVKFETGAVARQEKEEILAGLKLGPEDVTGKEWLTWVKVHVGDVGGGDVEVHYLCRDNVVETVKKGNGKAARFNVFLPAFLLPVGRLEISVESEGGLYSPSILLYSEITFRFRYYGSANQSSSPTDDYQWAPTDALFHRRIILPKPLTLRCIKCPIARTKSPLAKSLKIGAFCDTGCLCYSLLLLPQSVDGAASIEAITGKYQSSDE